MIAILALTTLAEAQPVACDECARGNAQLDALLDRLQKYVALDVPESVRSTASTESGSDASVTQVTGSMSRGQAPDEEEREVREEDNPPADPPEDAH